MQSRLRAGRRLAGAGTAVAHPGRVRIPWPFLAVLCLTTRLARGQDAPAAPPVEAPDSRSHPVGSLAGGYAYQTLYGVTMTGGVLDVAAGLRVGNFAYCGEAELLVGSTRFGLRTTAANLGFLIDGRIGLVRLGGGARVGVFDVIRVTPGNPLFAFTAGVYVRGAVDVIRFGSDPDGGGIFVFVKGSGDLADFVSTVLFGAVGGAGVRF
jgi:hypothetical protein